MKIQLAETGARTLHQRTQGAAGWVDRLQSGTSWKWNGDGSATYIEHMIAVQLSGADMVALRMASSNWHSRRNTVKWLRRAHEDGAVCVGDACLKHVELHTSNAGRLRHEDRAHCDWRQLRADPIFEVPNGQHLHRPAVVTGVCNQSYVHSQAAMRCGTKSVLQ